MDIAKIIIDIVLSIATICISIVAWKTSYKTQRITTEASAFNMINNAKSTLDKALFETKKNENKNFATLIEDYLNTMNYACSLYCDKAINCKRFKVLYSQDIKLILCKDIFQKTLDKNPNDFIYLRKVHIEITEAQCK